MRAFDIVAASSVLLLTSPLLLVVAFLVWVMDGGPALYSQPRIGRDGRHFRCLKFRSMCVDADVRLANLLATDENARREWQADHKLRVDPRITRLGAFLRKTSLDETPQLINVLRGEMSLVGPVRSSTPKSPAMAVASPPTAPSAPASPACGRSADATMCPIVAAWRSTPRIRPASPWLWTCAFCSPPSPPSCCAADPTRRRPHRDNIAGKKKRGAPGAPLFFLRGCSGSGPEPRQPAPIATATLKVTKAAA